VCRNQFGRRSCCLKMFVPFQFVSCWTPSVNSRVYWSESNFMRQTRTRLADRGWRGKGTANTGAVSLLLQNHFPTRRWNVSIPASCPREQRICPQTSLHVNISMENHGTHCAILAILMPAVFFARKGQITKCLLESGNNCLRRLSES
jgi:hypothetical protein